MPFSSEETLKRITSDQQSSYLRSKSPILSQLFDNNNASRSANPAVHQVTYRSNYDPRTEAFGDLILTWITTTLRAQANVGAQAGDMYRAMANIERCIREHIDCPESSLISRVLGPVKILTPLPMLEAFKRMDRKYRITRRLHVAPSIHECRQTMNLAQVLVTSRVLKLITFDGDETLYPDGGNFSDDETAALIFCLLRSGYHVALVTAAGYGQDPKPYMTRLSKLLNHFATHDLPAEAIKHFFVFGGESNYLFRMKVSFELECVPYEEWEHHCQIGFTESRDRAAAAQMLDIAEGTLKKCVDELGLRATVVRKERAVGVVPGGIAGLARAPQGSGSKRIRPEILEELVSRVRASVASAGCTIPYCAFNGGSDVWVDVGNKAIALDVLQSLLKISPTECLHIGDQFTESGNDISVRQHSPCIWVINPDETKAILRRIVRETRKTDESIRSSLTGAESETEKEELKSAER